MNVLEELLGELKLEKPKNLSVKYSGTGYSVKRDKSGTKIVCANNVQLAKALVEIKKHGSAEFSLAGNSAFTAAGPMFDVSRNGVLKVSTVKKLIRLSALMGYNTFMLYMEDVYPVDGRPYFGYLRGRYSKRDLREIDGYAAEFGIEVIPCIQTLAHLNTVKKWWALGDMFDVNDILLCDDEKTYAFIEDMFKSLRECFGTERVNIGMDEADMVGLGKYLKIHGYVDKFDLMLRHLKRVCTIAEKYNFKPMMWSDMFFRLVNAGDYYGENTVPENVKRGVPDNVSLVYWDYRSRDTAHYDRMIKEHLSFNREVWMAGIAWKCIGFAPHNRFSFSVADALFPALKDNGVKNFIVTCWGDNGAECSVFSALPALAYISLKCYGEEGEEQFRKTFEAITDCKLDDFLLIDELNRMGKDNLTVECPSKYFLYNDLFCGYLDSRTEQSFKPAASQLAAKLKEVKAGEYSLNFKTALALAEVLAVRLGLGITTRTAYENGDKAQLKILAEETYPLLYKRVKAFHTALREQWFNENKQNGFEVQDVRLGGLEQRIETCAFMLSDHVKNGTRLYELEEEILPFIWRENSGESHLDILNWANYVTVNNL
ncbi:MAG: beta-N-acetylhexosaminidase [Clostridia bacterium]|nr:beta-N-acetylhexosaminidase [Clostridia bacterium]